MRDSCAADVDLRELGLDLAALIAEPRFAHFAEELVRDIDELVKGSPDTSLAAKSSAASLPISVYERLLLEGGGVGAAGGGSYCMLFTLATCTHWCQR